MSIARVRWSSRRQPLESPIFKTRCCELATAKGSQPRPGTRTSRKTSERQASQPAATIKITPPRTQSRETITRKSAVDRG